MFLEAVLLMGAERVTTGSGKDVLSNCRDILFAAGPILLL